MIYSCDKCFGGVLSIIIIGLVVVKIDGKQNNTEQFNVDNNLILGHACMLEYVTITWGHM